jgi:hypothetical protein
LILAPDTLGHLNNDSTTFQLNLFAFVEFPVALPMHISNKIAAVIVDHDALIESVVFETAILPPLLFPSEIMGEEADEFEDWSAATAAVRFQ